MQHLVFFFVWPHAGAWGAGVIFSPCAQLLWGELYVIQKKFVGRAIYSSLEGRQEGAGAGVWGRISVLYYYRG